MICLGDGSEMEWVVFVISRVIVWNNSQAILAKIMAQKIESKDVYSKDGLTLFVFLYKYKLNLNPFFHPQARIIFEKCILRTK